MDAAANSSLATTAAEGAHSQQGSGAGMANPNVPVQGHAGDHLHPAPTREQLLEGQIIELHGRVTMLSAQLDRLSAFKENAAADARTLRLREVAIDTAIRHSGGAHQGLGADEANIVKAAAIYFAFLDTGAVPT